MMKKPLRKILLFSFWLLSFVLAEENIQKIHAESASISNLPSSISCTVTASDYAIFLNEQAPNDPNFLYDEKMGTDLQTASIVRLGTPGNFHYAVIEGKENDPVTFVDEYSKRAYCESKQEMPNSLANNLDGDYFLKSNQIDFSLNRLTPATLSLATNSNSNSSSDSSTLSKDATIAGAVMLVAGMMGGLPDGFSADSEGRNTQRIDFREGTDTTTLRRILGNRTYVTSNDAAHKRVSAETSDNITDHKKADHEEINYLFEDDEELLPDDERSDLPSKKPTALELAFGNNHPITTSPSRLPSTGLGLHLAISSSSLLRHFASPLPTFQQNKRSTPPASEITSLLSAHSSFADLDLLIPPSNEVVRQRGLETPSSPINRHQSSPSAENRTPTPPTETEHFIILSELTPDPNQTIIAPEVGDGDNVESSPLFQPSTIPTENQSNKGSSCCATLLKCLVNSLDSCCIKYVLVPGAITAALGLVAVKTILAKN